MTLYIISNKLYRQNFLLLAKVFVRLNRFIFGCEIPSSAEIDYSVQLKHGGLGVVIHDNAVIGKNTVIYHGVTVGGREHHGTPIIGENVYIGSGAKVLGNVKIGNGAKIGANAVVLRDVEEGRTVIGVPAKYV